MSSEHDQPDFAVLERNLELLLRHCYQPVRADPRFRARLERQVLELSRRSRPRPERTSPWSSPALRIALAASLAIACFVGVRSGADWIERLLGPRRASAALEQILARGEVAWRAGASQGWRAARGVDQPRAFVLAASGSESDYLEVATPPSMRARVDVEGPWASQWELGQASHAAFVREQERDSADAGSPGRVTVALEAGSLRGVRQDTTAVQPALRIVTSEGDVNFVHGVLGLDFSAPREPETWTPPPSGAQRFVHVVVDSGAASVADPRGSGALPLADGDELYICGGRVLLPRAATTSDARTPVDPPRALVDVATPEGARGVRGRVTADGAALDEFRIVALREVQLPQSADPIPREFSAARGVFVFEGLEPGPYRFFAIAPGFAVAKSEVLDVSEDRALSLEFALTRGGVLAGVVVDDLTGEPISDAYVVSESDTQVMVLSFVQSDNRGFDSSVRSRGNGAFEFERLSAGEHVVRASAPGFGAAWLEVQVVAGERRGDVELRLPRAGRIVGSVRDAFDQPVRRALVMASTTEFQLKRPCLSYRPILTDDDGRFELADLGPGAWAVLNFGPADSLRSATTLTPEMEFGSVRAGATTVVDFHAKRPPQVLRGVVRTSAGEPVRRRSLVVARTDRDERDAERAWLSCATLDDGSYTLPGLEPGEYEMYVSLRTPSEVLRVGRFEVLAGQATAHDVTLPLGTIGGRVRDGERERPLSGAVLVLLARGEGGSSQFVGKVFSAVDGTFEFSFLPSGRYDVYAYSARESFGQQGRVDLALEEGQRRSDVEFTLRMGGRVQVRVVDELGAGIPEALIEFRDEHGENVQFAEADRTNAKGLYAVNGISTGRWSVRVAHPAFLEDTREFDVARDERSDITLTLRRR